LKKLLIKKCQSPMLWYWPLVGETVQFIREDAEGYWSREPDGYVNVVLKQDAEIVEVDQ
jgi:hypothetical protein